jgi:hypothetical protein
MHNFAAMALSVCELVNSFDELRALIYRTPTPLIGITHDVTATSAKGGVYGARYDFRAGSCSLSASCRTVPAAACLVFASPTHAFQHGLTITPISLRGPASTASALRHALAVTP